MSAQSTIFVVLHIKKDNVPLDEIQRLRLNMFDLLVNETKNEDVDIIIETTRAIEPSIVGTIGLAILPSLVEKVGDLIVKWAEYHNDCSVTLSIPALQREPISITYNPRKVSAQELRLWIQDAVEAVASQEPKAD